MQNDLPRAVNKAVRYLLSRIQAGTFRPGTRLPPVGRLAADAGVSRATFLKAAHLLKQEGIIRGRSGCRFRIASDALISIEQSSPGGHSEAFHGGRFVPGSGPAWRRLTRRIADDIAQGIFPPGSALPSMKELCVRYGISFRPLKKALAALVENDLLEPRGVRYAVPGVGAARSGTSIVCVCFASRDKNRTVLGSVDKEFLGILERDCAHAGVGLSIVLVCHENDGFVFVNQKDRSPWDATASEGQTAGFIVLANVRRHFEPRVMHFLAARKKPCAVFDQVGIAQLKTVAARHRFMRIFTISSGMKPGRTVARYLLLKGHTKAAFFSPFHRADWSINRFKGLQRFFREAHPDTDMIPFVFEQAGSTEDFVDRAVHRMDTDNLHAWCAATAAAFRADTGIAYDPAGDLYSAIFRGCASVEVAEALQPLFVRALSRSEVTVWVMVNDTTALMALDFLTERGVRVPRDVSLVSFDNTLSALENGLTSFDFNVGAAVDRILAFLLYPLDFTCRHARPVVEIEGMIIERNSTWGAGESGTLS